VALFRDGDRTLIAGDAFVTTKQESALAVMTQRKEVHGPPAYYTQDWASAWASVELLAALEPEVAATGHGVPLRGEEMRAALHRLVANFGKLAVPGHGRYVGSPAIADETGVVSVPPRSREETTRILLGVGGAVLAGAALAKLLKPDKPKKRRRRRR
jgi:glyoxylase-like metal-dependent hydrolase (beta-lactamase superfamily II)